MRFRFNMMDSLGYLAKFGMLMTPILALGKLAQFIHVSWFFVLAPLWVIPTVSALVVTATLAVCAYLLHLNPDLCTRPDEFSKDI
jgi:cation transporter-like permease